MNSFSASVTRELLALLPALPAALWAISFHEFCHAWTALLCGDPTARDAGRLTLNPMAHFDLWGTLCMILFRFGWARPVPVNPRNFRNPRRGILLVSVAGIAGNVVSAIAFGLVIRALALWAPRLLWNNYGLQSVLVMFVLMNLNLAVFNLLPLPPLDGAKLLGALLPLRALPFLEWLERWNLVILMALIFFGVVGRVMAPLVMWAFRLIVG